MNVRYSLVNAMKMLNASILTEVSCAHADLDLREMDFHANVKRSCLK